jgi:uncharacterized membrane protein
VIDLVWLGVVAPKLYDHYIGQYLADNPKMVAAVVFYFLYVVGLVYFVVAPALDGGSLGQAAIDGALLGALAYMTFEMTSYAVIKDWPFEIVIIDIVWGAVLTSSVAAATYALASRFVI